MNKTPTLREQLEPLAADLEKARKIVHKAAKIIIENIPTAEFVALRPESHIVDSTDGSRPRFWFNLGHGSGQYYDSIYDVISACETFSPVDLKAERIAKLKAELAELEGK